MSTGKRRGGGARMGPWVCKGGGVQGEDDVCQQANEGQGRRVCLGVGRGTLETKEGKWGGEASTAYVKRERAECVMSRYHLMPD